MKRSTLSFRLAAVAALLAATQLAQAASLFAGRDVDPHFRAKIMKEKAKQNSLEAETFNFNQSANPGNTQCGAQNIGNVNTGGRFGTQPREVFVFAPNAINLVSGNGCR